jgi:formylglycine-generating enzyme required for sulfatase activity
MTVPRGPKTDLRTRELFRDFELEFDWRIGYGGNSGVFYGTEGSLVVREFQLVDDDRTHFRKMGGARASFPEDDTGALCGVTAPSGDKPLSPAGEWNHGRLLVRGTHVEHWVNGHKVVEYELGSIELGHKLDQSPAPWIRPQLTAKSKAQFSQPGDVPIGLQSHTGDVAFRNIRIRRLTPAPATASGATTDSNAGGATPPIGIDPEVASKLVWIPPGIFTMGSPPSEKDRVADEGPQTRVTLTRGFWMARRLVTQGDYQSVMGYNPSRFTGDLNRPVERVNWFDATNYCGKLTEQHKTARLIPVDDAYRLPTEAEWEYACRAGTTTRFSFGDDPTYENLTHYAWYSGNSGGRPHDSTNPDEEEKAWRAANSGGHTQAVGQKAPNPWGLYDMHGNVFEWCRGWYGPYLGVSLTDPQGPVGGKSRVYRGGSWGDTAPVARSALRGKAYGPSTRLETLGFRVVLAQPPREENQ